MLLLLLCKKWSSSFAGSSACSNLFFSQMRHLTVNLGTRSNIARDECMRTWNAHELGNADKRKYYCVYCDDMKQREVCEESASLQKIANEENARLLESKLYGLGKYQENGWAPVVGDNTRTVFVCAEKWGWVCGEVFLHTRNNSIKTAPFYQALCCWQDSTL